VLVVMIGLTACLFFGRPSQCGMGVFRERSSSVWKQVSSQGLRAFVCVLACRCGLAALLYAVTIYEAVMCDISSCWQA
jgi:hypothetical protein